MNEMKNRSMLFPCDFKLVYLMEIFCSHNNNYVSVTPFLNRESAEYFKKINEKSHPNAPKTQAYNKTFTIVESDNYHYGQFISHCYNPDKEYIHHASIKFDKDV